MSKNKGTIWSTGFPHNLLLRVPPARQREALEFAGAMGRIQVYVDPNMRPHEWRLDQYHEEVCWVRGDDEVPA